MQTSSWIILLTKLQIHVLYLWIIFMVNFSDTKCLCVSYFSCIWNIFSWYRIEILLFKLFALWLEYISLFFKVHYIHVHLCFGGTLLTCISLFLRFPSQNASWHLLTVSMAFTRYTKASRHFFKNGTWFVNAISLMIWKSKNTNIMQIFKREKN